ncbi:MAG: porin [Proteobacteria bacterium]|nr:porin [Pseudomonadota bacterium]
MKKSLIALAVLATSGAAMAQSSVTLFGVADAGVTYVNGKTNWTGITSGNQLTSRFGLRGSEDLGGGLKGNFWLEAGLNLDTGDGKSGGASGTGLEFKRRSTVGIEGGFGEVRLGRELTAAYNAVARYDPFGSVGLAYSRLWADGGIVDANANAGAVTTNLRVSNAVTYVSPNIAGFKAAVNYGFGEVAGNNSGSRYMGAGLTYDNGPLSLGLGLEQLKKGPNSSANGDITAWSLGGSYDLGVAKLLAAYRTSKSENFGATVNDNKRNGYQLAVTAPVGPGLVKASYNRYENKFAGVTGKADQFGLGYVYSLSKRTSVYGTYAYLKNKNGAALYTLGQGTLKDNGSQQGLQVGITHSF